MPNNSRIDHFIIAFDLPPEEAIKYLRKKVPTLTMTAKDFAEMQSSVRERSFTIAAVMQLDILQDVQDSIEEAMLEGKTYRDFAKDVHRVLEKRGWVTRKDKTIEGDGVKIAPHRLRTIFRTNTQDALNAGRRNQQLQITNKRPWWRFNAVVDPSTTDGCNRLQGVTLKYDDPFWNSNYPPRHFQCRSSVETLSQRELERDNISPSDSAQYAGVKPDKGFGGTPGQVYQPDKEKYTPALWKEFEKQRKNAQE